MSREPKPYAGMNVCQIVEAIFLMPEWEREQLVERCRELIPVTLEDEAEDEEYGGSTSTAPIVVWSFYNAPDELRALVIPDDVDWLAVVPPHLEDEYIGWMEQGTAFGCCEVSWHRGPNGERVVIGFHA